ncbi:Hypothetical protein, putative [Bodo saltans]|uniref:Membrane-associated protein n=1 Tax=Bodo saltans TaxID=75058 RepID=A0A0S4J766_BODSA|nr:Hypothetical protein, putative [Bodo saltans]|eukprot:CUG87080.1 Hypothetical protein, putative [Bodo saltans]
MLLGCLILFAVCFSSTTKNRGALLASSNSSATTAAEEGDSPSPLTSVEQPTHAVDADNLLVALPSGTSSVSDSTDRQEYPYRFAEGVNGTYSFKKITGLAQPAPVAPGPSQAAMFVPLLTVKRPPSPSEDPGYATHASSRPVIGGVYRSPYHEATCDVNLDPCETMRDTSLLHIADDDPNRPPINFLHCASHDAAKQRHCGNPMHRGYTVMYRHRFPKRWFESNLREFPGDYSDIGIGLRTASAHDSIVKAAQNATASDGGQQEQNKKRWRFRADADDDCSPQMEGMRTLSSRRIGVGYGLTNKLISAVGMMALASRTGRVLGLDNGHGRIRMSSLINLTTSVFPTRLRFVKKCRSMPAVDARHSIAGKGKHGYKLIDRRMVARRPRVVMTQLENGFYQLRHAPALVFHDMYQRYPYEQDMDLRSNAGTVFCGLQFAGWIERAAHMTIRRLRNLAWKSSGERTRRFAALHFRQELSDSIAMRRGRRQSTAAHALAFLEDAVAPLLKSRGIGVLVVCSGPLDSALWGAMRSKGQTLKKKMKSRGIGVLVVCSGPLDSALWGAMRSKGQTLGVQVVSKSEMLGSAATFNDFGSSAYDREGSVRIKVTSADGAAADVLVMERADLVLLTTTSSLSSLVYAKRCGGSAHLGASVTWNRTRASLGLANDEVSERFPGRVFDNYGSGCSLVGQVYLYDGYLDGSFTNAVEYPCGYQFGDYIVAPPALVPRPPAAVDVVTMRFKPDSVDFLGALN